MGCRCTPAQSLQWFNGCDALFDVSTSSHRFLIRIWISIVCSSLAKSAHLGYRRSTIYDADSPSGHQRLQDALQVHASPVIARVQLHDAQIVLHEKVMHEVTNRDAWIVASCKHACDARQLIAHDPLPVNPACMQCPLQLARSEPPNAG